MDGHLPRGGVRRAGRVCAALPILVAGAIAAGCRRPPAIAEIRVTPNPVSVGSNALVTLSLRYPRDGMRFQWTASSGDFRPSATQEPRSTFLAPQKAGPVRLMVGMEVNGQRHGVKEVLVHVVSSPPPPPIPTGVCTNVHSVHLTVTPQFDPKGNAPAKIAGLITEITREDAADHQIVIYSKTDDWWVQPKTDQPFTSVGEKGEFEQVIFSGTEYAVLVVSRVFTATDATPRTPVLPARDGKKIECVYQFKGALSE